MKSQKSATMNAQDNKEESENKERTSSGEQGKEVVGEARDFITHVTEKGKELIKESAKEVMRQEELLKEELRQEREAIKEDAKKEGGKEEGKRESTILESGRNLMNSAATLIAGKLGLNRKKGCNNPDCKCTACKCSGDEGKCTCENCTCPDCPCKAKKGACGNPACTCTNCQCKEGECNCGK